MTEKTIDVTGIGNAIVDIVSQVEDENFFKEFSFKKGSMNLIDEETAKQIYAYLEKLKEAVTNKPPPDPEAPKRPNITVDIMREISGGSAANTVAAVTAFGGRAGFIGKVKNDHFGTRFVTRLQSRGVDVHANFHDDGPQTGHSFIIITPDKQRTMCTFPGSSDTMTGDDLDDNLLKRSKIIFLTGFLWDSDATRETALKSIAIAKSHDCKIAFTLADAQCVARHHDAFEELIADGIDILFANKEEINTLCECSEHTNAVEQIALTTKDKPLIALLTSSEAGAYVAYEGQKHLIPTKKIDNIIDTTGVGSLFAAGFLYGYTHGMTPERATKLANLAAAQGLQTLGARPTSNLSPLLRQV